MAHVLLVERYIMLVRRNSRSIKDAYHTHLSFAISMYSNVLFSRDRTQGGSCINKALIDSYSVHLSTLIGARLVIKTAGR